MQFTIARRELFVAGVALAAALSSSARAQQGAAADTTRFVILFSDRVAGHLKAWREGQEYMSEYEFNDRGRGPHIRERVAANASSYITRASIIGHNYLKDSVDERFSYDNGTASWKNNVEGVGSKAGPLLFYSSLDGTLAENDLLLQALLNAGGKPVSLFPSGELTIEKVRDLQITAPGLPSKTVSLYAISGFAFSPWYVWLDESTHFFGVVSAW